MPLVDGVRRLSWGLNVCLDHETSDQLIVAAAEDKRETVKNILRNIRTVARPAAWRGSIALTDVADRIRFELCTLAYKNRISCRARIKVFGVRLILNCRFSHILNRQFTTLHSFAVVGHSNIEKLFSGELRNTYVYSVTWWLQFLSWDFTVASFSKLSIFWVIAVVYSNYLSFNQCQLPDWKSFIKLSRFNCHAISRNKNSARGLKLEVLNSHKELFACGGHREQL